MAGFAQQIRPYVQQEVEAAQQAEAGGDPQAAFCHLERAHVLGQASTAEHVRVHWLMLRWAIRHRRQREVIGQIFRLLGAASKTAFGLVPTGNTGGTSVSPFKPLPIAADLQRQIDTARQTNRVR